MSIIPGNTGVAASFPDGFQVGNGTVTAPAYKFSDSQTGFYRPGTNQWALTSNGVQTWLVSAAGAHTIGPIGFTGTHNIISNITNISYMSIDYASNELNWNTRDDADRALLFNYSGFNGGTTRFRTISFYNGKNVNVGGYNVNGAWTFGPATGGVAHAVRGSLRINRTDNATYNEISYASPDKFQFNQANGGTYNFAVNGTDIGSASATGAWTFGLSGSNVQHRFNGNDLRIVRNANTSASLLTFANSDGTSLRGIVGISNDAGGGFFTGAQPSSLSLWSAGGLDFFTNGGSLYSGLVSSAGAWTLGPSSGTISHTIQSPGNPGGTPSLYVRKQAVAANSSGNSYVEFYGTSNGFDGYIGVTGTTLAVIDASDSRKKENIREANYGLNEVMALHPVLFDWKVEHGGEANIKGFLAQEVETVLPECVTTKDETETGGFVDAKFLATSNMMPVLVKAIQELKAELDEAKSEIELLKGGN